MRTKFGPTCIRRSALGTLYLLAVLSFFAPVSASSDRPSSQSLQHIRVSFSSSKWEVLQDASTSTGPSLLALRGLGRSAPTIFIAEWNADTSQVSAETAYAQVEASTKAKVLSLTRRPVPKGSEQIWLPANWLCGHYEAVTRARPDRVLYYSQCVLVSKGWWAYTTLNTTAELTPDEGADIKAVLSSVRGGSDR